jgi:hypothetical protein
VDDANLGGSPGRSHLDKELDIGRVVLRPLLGEVILVVDGFDWTHRFAGSTIHALIRVDVEHPVTFIDAINRALINAGAVFDINTGERDYVGHGWWVLSGLSTDSS